MNRRISTAGSTVSAVRQPRASIRAPHVLNCFVILIVGAWLPPTFAQETGDNAASSGDVMIGWQIFNDKQCVDCHSIWDQGGRIGPDLGRIRTGQMSRGQLAGIMWNHIPKMLGRMEQVGQPPISLTRSEMRDIFALIYFVRQLDKLGDPLEGDRILRQKGCAECHSIDDPDSGDAPDLAKWGSYANPVIWAHMMWEHAPVMEEAMLRSGISWPKLEGDDLVHIVAYVRSAGISGEKTYLRPGAPEVGHRLFAEKQCAGCHPGSGPDLEQASLPTSIGALASHMWNHSPEMIRVMREEDVTRKSLTSQELTDILAYVLSLGTADRGGNASRGRRIFEQKGCAQCHEADDMVQADMPTVQQLGIYASPVNMATAMWNHGRTMLEKMTEAGMSWPVFADNEMVDLLTYLKSIEPSGGNAEDSEEEIKK